MKGRGTAGGAVSIVNAIATGRGAALGTNLKTEAYLETAHETGYSLTINGESHDPALVKAVVETFAKKLDIEIIGARVETFSDIPMAVGLKSSSSAAVAIAKAFLNAVGATMDSEKFLKLVADASVLSGTSITGALDDAAACMLGGAVVTDNFGRKILRHEKIKEKLAAVILVPPGKTYTSQFRKELLTPVNHVIETAFKLALNGQYWTAMTVNGLAVSAAIGLSAQPAVEALRAGALGAGVSGTGPAVSAIVGMEKVDEVAEAFASFEGRVIKCLVNGGDGG
ncbi:MAG: shikimate kinase [Candidatus Caldarchaeum sp.]|nr:shikimate kinase [Candidatus Caldarchaeum sp.]